MGKPVVKKKVVHHTRAERLALTRKKRKEGPAAKNRAERRAVVASMRAAIDTGVTLTFLEFTRLFNVPIVTEFGDRYAMGIAEEREGFGGRQTLTEWRASFDAWLRVRQASRQPETGRADRQAAYALAHPPSPEQPAGEATDVGPELLHTPTLAELEDVFRPADEALCAEQQACDRESWANGDRPSREVPS